MKVIKNDFEVVINIWEDPGDYPSNAGQSPLPSFEYVECVEGECVIELDANEDWEDFVEIPRGISVCKWDIVREGNKVILHIDEFELEEEI